MRETYLGTHMPPPHLEFALLGNKTQVCGVQVYFRSCSLSKTYESVVAGIVPMFVGVTCPSFFFISTRNG